MAKKKYNEQEGVWRTIGGRRVFIRTGQSLSDAMKESGKFKKASDVKREEYQYKKDKLEREREAENSRKYIGKEERIEEGQQAFNKYAELHDRTYVRENPQEADSTYDLVGKHISGEQQLRDIGNKNPGLGYSQKQNLLSEKNEYDLYKRAMENPDSIDPMTENSTDWEALDRKYSDRYKKEYIKVKRYPDDPNNHEYTSVKRNLDEKLKVPRASGAKDFSEYGIRIEDNDTKTRFSNYLRDKYGTDDFRIISYDDSKKAQNIYSEFNKQELKAYQDKILNSDEYLAKNNPGMYLTKLEKEAGVRTFADEIKDNEIENSIKSLFIYQDEKNMGSTRENPLEEYYDKYRKENVDRVWKQMGKKYDVIKGVSMDSEGLRYNILVEKDKYSPEAIQYYKNATETAYKNFGYDTKKYNEAVNRAKKDFENYDKINPTYEDDIDKIMSRYSAGTLRQKYSGTVDYLQKTTNMSGADILELLKKIEQDKK